MISSITRRISIVFVLCVAGLLHAAPAEKFITYWTVAENQLRVEEGGRANTIAVNPYNREQMFVASDTGGLWRTNDRGLQWSRVDSLPVIFTQAVVYHPLIQNLVLVTAKADFKSHNGGGLWRSTDNGVNWQQVDLVVPNFTGRLSAYGISEISRDGAIVVGTSQGVFTSADDGAHWTYSDVFGDGADKTVLSVSSISNRIYAGGPAGVRLAFFFSLTWVPPATSPGPIQDIHAFATMSAVSPSLAYAANGARQLFVTNDSGANWVQIASAPQGSPSCGGAAFIKAQYRNINGFEFVDLYHSNRCSYSVLAARYNRSTDVVTYPTDWHTPIVDASGTRDLAFGRGEPQLLATNAGVHNTANLGNTWHLTGGGMAGYNALQLSELKEQFVAGSFGLYVGSRDTGLWSANLWGNIYQHYPATAGYFIQAERKVAADTHSKITFVACSAGGCANKVSGWHFETPGAWPNPTGTAGAPTFVRSNPVTHVGQYVQQVTATTELPKGLAVSENAGLSWQRYAPYPEEPRDIARLGRSGDTAPDRNTILYQSFRRNLAGSDVSEAGRLIRIHKRLFIPDPARVMYPLMTGFGGLGVNPAATWYQVYGVDPGNAFHIIAPDVVGVGRDDGPQMRESTDGGETWHRMPDLTALVTNGGQLLFRTDLLGAGTGPIFPVVTAVSFCPDDPRLVLVGTSEGGIYLSTTNGQTWRKMTGSEPVKYVTSFSWMNANDVFVSTYGRGLWRLRNRRIAVQGAFDELCGTCDVVSNDAGPGRPPFDGSALVFDGRIVGVRTEKSQLREIVVTPGSSVVFTGDQDDPQDDIVITESDGKDEKGLEPLPSPPKGGIVKGVVFTSGDKLTGTVFGDGEATLVPPVSKESYDGPTDSPTKGTPYIQLTSAAFNGVATMLPNEVFELSATGFLGGTGYEVLVDGVARKGQVAADGAGSFKTRITAPSTLGYHQVAVRAPGDANVIDTTMFLVTNDN